MKKLLSVVLVIVLVLAVASFASAAVTVSGNLRTWFIASQNGDNHYLADFSFDRLVLEFKSDLGKDNGMYAQLQIRSIRSETTGTGAPPIPPATTASGYAQVKNLDYYLDQAYYYQNNVFAQGDKIMVGALDPLPFNAGYGNGMQIMSLGGAYAISTNVGMIYSYAVPGSWDLGFGLADARSSWAREQINYATSKDTNEGFDYSTRFNYYPIKGLKVGAGYEYVVTGAADGNIAVDPSKNNDTRMIIDACYQPAPFGGLIEYLAVNPTVTGVSKKALNGIYAEANYKSGAFLAYWGRAIDISSSDALADNKCSIISDGRSFGNGAKVMGYGSSGSIWTNPANNFNTIGINYTLPAGPILKWETMLVDDSTATPKKWYSGIQLRVNF